MLSWSTMVCGAALSALIAAARYRQGQARAFRFAVAVNVVIS
jgi:hypothetical protein